MATVYRPSGRKNYIIEWVDENGKRHRKSGTSDRKVAQQIARNIETRKTLRREGMIDSKQEAYATHEGRPLSDHLDAWRDNLLHEGSTPKHADQTADRVRRLIAVMFGAKPDDIDGKTMNRTRQEKAREAIGRLVDKARLSDVVTERVQAALAAFRNSGRSAQTCNHYRAGIRAFVRWAKRTGRLREYSLEGLTGFNVKEDRRHDRRTLALDELQRLIVAAERGPDFQAMNGPARALCYRLAASTGLRFSEIGSIRPRSFDWEAPSVTIQAAYTKNGDPATLTLPDDVAADLRPYVATLAADASVFPLPEKGAEMLRVDLAAAGIPYMDASGLFFDFHSLRCQMATMADAAGFSTGVVQRRMRHSTQKLTEQYIRPRAMDIDAVASRLPSLRPTGDRPERLAMTGTDGPSRACNTPEITPQADADGLDTVGTEEVASISHRSTEPKVSGSNPLGCITTEDDSD